MEVTSSPVSDPADDPSAATQSPARRRRRRSARRIRLADRVTMSTVIGVVAALLVFVLAALLLRDRREMVTVAVTTERIPAGATITESMVDRSEVPSSVGFVDGLVTFDELGPATVATRTLQAGEAIPRSAIGGREQTSGARVMAIPVESWQAAGGELDVGDQVDVIDTGDGGPRYVLSGGAVVGRSVEDDTGGLGASTSNVLWISVEVNADRRSSCPRSSTTASSCSFVRPAPMMLRAPPRRRPIRPRRRLRSRRRRRPRERWRRRRPS